MQAVKMPEQVTRYESARRKLFCTFLAGFLKVGVKKLLKQFDMAPAKSSGSFVSTSAVLVISIVIMDRNIAAPPSEMSCLHQSAAVVPMKLVKSSAAGRPGQRLL